MTHNLTTRATGRHRRSGTALILAIICLTLTTAMSVSLVRLTLASHQQVEREQWRLQSVWLAESGLSRAVARLRANDAYTGEMWVPADIGPNRESGSVAIVIDADPQDVSRLTITATADFPNDPTDRVRITRTQTFPRGHENNTPQPSEE